MTKIFAALLLSCFAASASAAMQWSGADPLPQFQQIMAESPATAPLSVAGKAVDGPALAGERKRLDDMRRWIAIYEAARVGDPVHKEDVEWAKGKLDWVIARSNLRADIRKQVKLANDLQDREDRLSRRQRRATVGLLMIEARAHMLATLEKAQLKA